MRAFFTRIGLYEIIAFVTGFVLMAYELVASRILAPTIGTSIYVWTSVIGVMIAALAIGYATGGWIADKRNRRQDLVVLLTGAAVGITLTAAMYESVLSLVSILLADPRAQGVLAAFLLFAPASFALGMVSPYLAKLRISSLRTTGRSVAGLGALNSLGGITGTFLTGFVFFHSIGSRETLILLVILVLACSWAIMPRWRFSARLTLSLILCVTVSIQSVVPAAATTGTDIDTATARYKIINISYSGRQVRVLSMGPSGYQSGVYTTGNKDLVFDYARKIADVVHAAPAKDHMVIVGGGAFTLPEYLGRHYPHARIDVVEIDPQLPAIARRYFRYQPTGNIHIYSKDARTFLRQAAAGQYDIAIIDAYNDDAVPFSLATKEYAQQVRTVLKPAGIVAANIVGGTNATCLPLLSSVHGSYKAAFASSRLYAVNSRDVRLKQNIIGVYSPASVDWAAGISGTVLPAIPAGRPLTDNFAPTEHLIQQCV